MKFFCYKSCNVGGILRPCQCLEKLGLNTKCLFQVFDGRGDCTDFSDECPIESANKRENIFSSRYELIANPILRAMVWIMGILALVGNTVNYYHEYYVLSPLLQHNACRIIIINVNLVCVCVYLNRP